MGEYRGLILIANKSNLINLLWYSYDEGLTWQELRFSNNQVMVHNFIIEITSTSRHFIVIGEGQVKKGETTGFIIGVDFSKINEQQCWKRVTPDNRNSDYETWTPNDGRQGHNCLLGSKTMYVRRML